MIKFFRKIKQELLSENKFSKYLIYAIGEIVLVVIGILIALSINNWNEARKTKRFEYDVLRDIKTSIEGNFFQINLGLEGNEKAIESADIILKCLRENLPYHDSLNLHFSRSIEWWAPSFHNAGYQSLKTYGRKLITNDSIREALGIYDAGWMEILGQRQEVYFYSTASPVLTKLFDKVVMMSEMKPFEYEQLRLSKEYISILNTSKAYRMDQIYWHKKWKEALDNLYQMINTELEKQ